MEEIIISTITSIITRFVIIKFHMRKITDYHVKRKKIEEKEFQELLENIKETTLEIVKKMLETNF
ncbi:hypothetical protein [Helcococcus sueciensis]|uniref:hypothetical protein n=1 Tax=Helcococcus sueciensis TaxID=241555 RepID=UPI0004172529|nr:hypothetical protein [Helcococcus sueciensis]